ncbi:scavenger receptor cysteine-rich type 1 protein M130 [Nematolebias whitei]|uniref:scavenger receptor cysteine-rich type 1 protein M130 n=1 Tax=Nematolebias whitei TaxID=451745 RepID=UPI001898B19D|nr:scavenger receptor cysteine-rich type 1 protein M130 [Nematolebias whitei]
MWLLLLLLLRHSFAHTEFVDFQDHFRVVLQNRTNPCEGPVEVYYNSERGYVGDKYWDARTEEVACRSTHCGVPVQNSTSNVRRSMKRKVWLNELQCAGTEQNLWDCPGWPAPGVSFYQKATVKKIKCSNNVSISLKQHRCEGAVQFSMNDETGYICKENFGENDARHLCERLGCGEFEKMLTAEWMTELDFQHSRKMMLNCSGIAEVTHLWQCVRPPVSVACQRPASVSCEGHRKLQLKGNSSNVCSGQLEQFKNGQWETLKENTHPDKWCKQMHCGDPHDLRQTKENLTCSDNVRVVLMNNNQETKCYGEVYVNVNGTNTAVCGSGWSEKEAEIVCKELNCGAVLPKKTKLNPALQSGIMDHVKCERGEASLWHCRAKRGHRITCSTVPYVVCAGSVDVKLVDGPGKCSGRLAVQDEGQWKQVSSAGWTDEGSDIVCKHFECGDKSRRNNKDKFIKGTGDTVTMTCEKDSSKISDCKISPNPSSKTQDPVGITCEGHKVIFLNGPGSCSGRVGVEQGDRTFWLSGSNETWDRAAANTVCQQLHCGEAKTFGSEPYSDTDVWKEFYSCSPNDKSLFDCHKTAPPPDSNRTIAKVTCTGNVKLPLTNKCWGDVHISAAGKSGGVYADTWTADMSTKLCEEQECGDTIQSISSPSKGRDVIFKSLHARSRTSPLNQYSFVKIDDNAKIKSKNKAYVVCKDSVEVRFSTTRDKCSGNIQILYEGRWHPVLKSSLENTQTRNAICKELKCGNALAVNPYFGPAPAEDHVISITECRKNNFSSCQITPENAAASRQLGALHCSGWRKMALEVDYACKGELSVYSKGTSEDKRSVVFSQDWQEAEGKRLCLDMNCGNFKRFTEFPLEASETVWNKTFTCSSNATNIWDCEKAAAPTEQKKLYIECGVEPNVSLSKPCAGVVSIDGVPVCDRQWKLEYSHRVCQQLNCGNAIEGLLESRPASNKESYHVRCDEHNYIIGQCHRVKGRCQNVVSIYCTGNVSFNTTKKCSGQITINYDANRNRRLCKANVSDALLNNTCQRSGCGSFTRKHLSSSDRKDNVEVSLQCPSIYRDMRYCVKKEACETPSPLLIECEDFESALEVITQKPTNPVPILVGVGIVLVLVMLIVIFISYRIILRNQKSRVLSNMLPQQEGEWESGDYEVMDKEEIEDCSHDRFRSESEIKRDKDVESHASLSYDDIEEVAEAQPLTSPGSTDAAAPEDKVPNTSDGKFLTNFVSYEVDDAQENCGDIDASPELAQTRAEVHNRVETSPGTDAAAPQDSEQKEDYLVPGRDG